MQAPAARGHTQLAAARAQEAPARVPSGGRGHPCRVGGVVENIPAGARGAPAAVAPWAGPRAAIKAVGGELVDEHVVVGARAGREVALALAAVPRGVHEVSGPLVARGMASEGAVGGHDLAEGERVAVAVYIDAIFVIVRGTKFGITCL